MKTRSGYESCDQTDEVVVHVAWVSEWSCARRHDCRDQRVDLGECGRVDFQALRCDSVQRRIVQDNLF